MNPRRYVDFKLYLTRPAEGGCQVTLLPTLEVGEAGPVTVPAGEGPDANLLPFLANKSITWRQLVTLGKGLARWLLPEGDVRKLYEQALNQVGNERGVRLRLIIAHPELQKWPWEYAFHDPLGAADSPRGFLALDPRLSIVRHEPLPIPHPVPARRDALPTRLPVVVAAASPTGQPPLRLDQEVSAIKKALDGLVVDGLSIVPDPVLMNATPPQLDSALRGVGSAFVFHFAGHGLSEPPRSDPFTRGRTVEQGVLLFVDDDNSEIRVPADLLAQHLQQADVRLVVLGACYSGLRSERSPWDSVAGALAYRRIPAIVAMQYEIIDAQATVFGRAFYGALAAGLSLDEAMTLGRLAIYQEMPAAPDEPVNVEWGVPVLYSRLPDGILLPERSEVETTTAQKLRSITQQVGTIRATGEVIGIDSQTLEGSFDVHQTVDDVVGTLIGARLRGANEDDVRVEQEAQTVSGHMIGLQG